MLESPGSFPVCWRRLEDRNLSGNGLFLLRSILASFLHFPFLEMFIFTVSVAERLCINTWL